MPVMEDPMRWQKPATALFLAALSLVPAAAGAGFNPFGALNEALQETSRGLSSPAAGAQAHPVERQAAAPGAPGGQVTADQRRVVYEGYSQLLVPIKEMVRKGQLKQALAALVQQYKEPQQMDLLAHLQVGLLELDSADTREAVRHFTMAEQSLVADSGQSTVGGFFSGFKNLALSTVSGNAELSDYQGAGFERVLMLNYKSIAYMLQGERKAYNVTRRAIDLQNIEKKRFDEKVREAKKEIRKEKKKQKGKGAELEGLDALVEQQYKVNERKALSVPSAFVNPFGFYIAGVVQELDSYEDPSLRDNARISYKKALELNPKSKVIKLAMRQAGKPPPRNRRLVHVIVGDGFAPEKKLLKFDLSLGRGLPTEIELPIYEPVPNKVHRIEVQTTKGRRWARLSEVSDITALALRYQKDAGPLVQLRMMTTVIRNLIEGEAWNQAAQRTGLLGGVILSLKKERDKMAHPDLRSWSLLPSRLLAARFYVPRSVNRLKIVSYDKRGRVLASKLVKLDEESHNLVYARTLDKTIYTVSSKKMWIGR